LSSRLRTALRIRRLRRIDQGSSNNVLQTRSIEAVDWEGNVDAIIKVIKKKCKRAYPDPYLLLINARHGEGVLDFDRVIEEMKTIRSPFLAPGGMRAVRVSPSAFLIDLNMSRTTGGNEAAFFCEAENSRYGYRNPRPRDGLRPYSMSTN
jgi:hypothetical protein